MADLILEGLLQMESVLVRAADKSHNVWTTENVAGRDGKVNIVLDDLKLHASALTPILQSLNGRQPAAVHYANAMHTFDAASDCKLARTRSNTLESDKKNGGLNSNVYGSWLLWVRHLGSSTLDTTRVVQMSSLSTPRRITAPLLSDSGVFASGAQL
jgi:hypothetical protein